MSDSTGKVVSFGLIAATLALMYEVLSRHLFDAPTIWAHEFSALVYVACLMFGGAYALRHKAHVNVDVLYGRLSPRGRAIVDIITATLMFLICWVILWYGCPAAWKSLMWREGLNTPWSPPVYPNKILVVVAALMLTLQVLAKLIRDVYMAIRRREIA